MNTSHYPSLELCRKLTEIGFPTTFQHIWDSGWTVIWCWEIPEWMYVSPSVMEMLDVMPNVIYDEDGNEFYQEFWKGWCHYIWFEDVEHMVTSDTTPNALASMILWLHENKYITFNK